MVVPPMPDAPRASPFRFRRIASLLDSVTLTHVINRYNIKSHDTLYGTPDDEHARLYCIETEE